MLILVPFRVTRPGATAEKLKLICGETVRLACSGCRRVLRRYRQELRRWNRQAQRSR